MNDISIILNGYKRKDALTEQYESLKNQTIVPSEILLWYNYPGDESYINYDVMEKIPTAFSNKNMGVWARFAYALNAKSKYICIFDDDMIPGKLWLENCLDSIKKANGLLGAVGLQYLKPNTPENSSYYEPYIRYGWVDNGHSNEIKQVDFVGHVWFFEREWLSYYWRELPDPKFFTCGEDMHFSYMLQKYSNIKTYVPPHPDDNTEMWGNVSYIKYAADKNSLWETNQSSPEGVPFKKLMNDAFIEQRMKGWKLINE